ncbi:hypothetical protein [Kurthia sibirica]|uniref:Uncharacterized protein n=1 Tax=Kurthia sibirica TaxID=202750 RepID=A0A2U3AKG6_9BACL|nr:hypothetical protein [Kurthia sibirica]PWI25027.1 hypothetical protein DEX24_10665 [Kurthia sibirica]GEK33065.1 hypothetical protein KSI01_05980 [Kurthia sibirica]
MDKKREPLKAFMDAEIVDDTSEKEENVYKEINLVVFDNELVLQMWNLDVFPKDKIKSTSTYPIDLIADNDGVYESKEVVSNLLPIFYRLEDIEILKCTFVY